MPVEPVVVSAIASIVTMFLTDERYIQCLRTRLFRARIDASEHLISVFAWIGAYAWLLIVAFDLLNTSATVVTIIAVFAVAFIFDNTIVRCVAFQRVF